MTLATFTLPVAVLQAAVRFPSVAVGVPAAVAAAVAPVVTLTGDALTDFREAADAAAHEGERQPCLRCQKKGHWARWRGYPVLDPGPCPPGDVITDLLELCACCFWGPSADPIYRRLQREAHDGRDIHVEHLDRDTGRWTRFETEF